MAGNRKFFAYLGLAAIATALLVFDVIDQGTWADVEKWVFGLFAGANVASKVANTVKIKTEGE